MDSVNDILYGRGNFSVAPANKPDPLPPVIAPTSAPPPAPTKNELLDETIILRSLLYEIKDKTERAIRILNKDETKNPLLILKTPISNESPEKIAPKQSENIIEGVFNGISMIGPDGKEYPVPPNYASKSKLIEGDMMKLTITDSGSFIYKQIGPIARKRIVGELLFDQETQQWSANSDNQTYKILLASATFYKAVTGDKAVLIVPKECKSEWAAIDNLLPKQ